MRPAPENRASGSDEVLTLLRALLAGQQQILDELRAQRRGRRRRRRRWTAAEDAAFLATLARCVGPRVFAAHELLAHIQEDPALRQALAGMMSPKQIGNRLRVLAGRDLDLWRLERINRDEHGCNWAIVPSELQARAGADPAAGR